MAAAIGGGGLLELAAELIVVAGGGVQRWAHITGENPVVGGDLPGQPEDLLPARADQLSPVGQVRASPGCGRPARGGRITKQ